MAQVSGTGRSTRLRSASSRKAAFALGLLFAILGGIFAAVSTTAGAATEATVDAISGSDLDVYPNVSPSIFPDGCTADGTNILTDVQFSLNHEGTITSSNDLNNFDLVIGDTITMTWDGYADDCAGVGISLAVKATQQPIFVPETEQELVDYQYCSGADCGSQSRFGSLSITIPAREAACNFQLDAVIGPPLSVVGPSGSFYNNEIRQANGKADGPSMLISANNGGEGKCIIPPTADAILTCATSSVDVAVHNPDNDDVAHVDVLKNDVVVANDVAVGTLDDEHVSVPMAEGETATITVVDTLTDATIFSQTFTADCLDANATAVLSCSEGGVVINLTNGGDGTAHFTVTVGDSVTQHDVAKNTPFEGVFPVDEDATVQVTVTESGETLVDESFTQDCQEPSVAIVHDCAEDGATFTFKNDGESPTTVTVTKNGTEIDQVIVPGNDSVTKTYTMNEDETATFRATGTGLDTGDQTMTFDCVLAQQETTTTLPEEVEAAQLARTGAASTIGMTTVAGLLLMVGGLLTAVANRPALVAAQETRTRGR